MAPSGTFLTNTRDIIAALDGWTVRDSDGQPPCNIERGTTDRGNLEVLATGLSYGAANVLASALQTAHDALELFGAERDLTARERAWFEGDA